MLPAKQAMLTWPCPPGINTSDVAAAAVAVAVSAAALAHPKRISVKQVSEGRAVYERLPNTLITFTIFVLFSDTFQINPCNKFSLA